MHGDVIIGLLPESGSSHLYSTKVWICSGPGMPTPGLRGFPKGKIFYVFVGWVVWPGGGGFRQITPPPPVDAHIPDHTLCVHRDGRGWSDPLNFALDGPHRDMEIGLYDRQDKDYPLGRCDDPSPHGTAPGAPPMAWHF